MWREALWTDLCQLTRELHLSLWWQRRSKTFPRHEYLWGMLLCFAVTAEQTCKEKWWSSGLKPFELSDQQKGITLSKPCELGMVALFKINILLKFSLLKFLLSPFQKEQASDSRASPLTTSYLGLHKLVWVRPSRMVGRSEGVNYKPAFACDIFVLWVFEVNFSGTGCLCRTQLTSKFLAHLSLQAQCCSRKAYTVP